MGEVAMKWVAYGLAFSVVALVVAIAFGSRRWDRDSRSLAARLSSTGTVSAVTPPPDSLPAPVARYFANAFTGEPIAGRRLLLAQEGTFRMSEGDNGWKPFTATQHVDLTRPGFIWDARIEMAPLLSVRVRDAYVDGRATMVGKLASLVTVVDEGGREELSSGALLRYLAEAAWFPTSLLPSETLRWRAVDDDTAAATLSDGALEVTANFTFDDAGHIVGVSADRYREVDGDYVLTPWEGRFWNHAVLDGVRLPLEAEVGWKRPEGLVHYWRGKIVDYAIN